MTVISAIRPVQLSDIKAQSPSRADLSADTAIAAEDILKLNDPEYNKAWKELSELKRVEKGLRNPAGMDQDICQRFQILGKERTKAKCNRISNFGMWTMMASFAPLIPLLITTGPVIALGVTVPAMAGGALLYYDLYKKIAGPRLDSENMKAAMKEAGKSIDSDIAASEARFVEVRERALKRALENVSKDNAASADVKAGQDVIDDEDDCIVIGGIKLKKHAEPDDAGKGGLLKFFRNSVIRGEHAGNN